MENKIYYIYHIPTFLHKNGRIGKIGCTVQTVYARVNKQGYTDFEILEEHTDIMVASDREIELQKEYGYPVDKVPYYIVYQQRMKTQPTPEQRRDGSIKSGNLAKERGQIQQLGISKRKSCIALDIVTNEIVKEFESVYAAHIWCFENNNKRTKRARIRACCNGKLKSAGGYKWKWKNYATL